MVEKTGAMELVKGVSSVALLPNPRNNNRSDKHHAPIEMAFKDEKDGGSHTITIPGDILEKAAKATKLQMLHTASLSGDEAEVKRLLGKGVDVNLRDSFGKTPIHNAIIGRHVEIVKQLLKAGANIKNKDERGDTPLHDAARVESEEIVEVLLAEKNCDANAKGFNGYTPLHIAGQIDNVNICRKLVEHGGSVVAAADDKMTPLSSAVAKGASNAVEYFLSKAKEKEIPLEDILYYVDQDGTTLLHLAVDSGILPIVAICLRAGANIRQTKESDGGTAFHLACSQGSLEIVQLLAGEDKDLCKANLVDSEGATPLHKAASFGHTPVVAFQLEQGATVDPLDQKCRTPLFLAALSGQADTVQVLMERGANISLVDLEKRSALHAAVPYEITAEMLCRSPAAKPMIVKLDVTGYAPVHYATRGGGKKVVSLFVSKNKEAATVKSDSQDTPLHIASKYGWLQIVKMLLKKRNVRIINSQNAQGRTPLHLAAGEGHDEITEFLLQAGATIESDQNERTPLHMAALNGSELCVEHILQAHPDCLNILEKHQNTALNLAAMAGHAQIVSRLLSVKEQDILLNAYNQSVLDLAINADKREVTMAIAEHDRWREVILVSPGGGVTQIQTLVRTMPDVAEKVLDRCIEREGDPSSKDYKITYDLGLVQGKYSTDQKFQESLAALRTMAERRRENCLTHPVCYLLMKIKWRKFGWITFFLNLSIYVAFLFCFTALTVYLRSNEQDFCGIVYNTTNLCSSSLIVRETPNPSLVKYSDMQDGFVKLLHIVCIVLACFHLSKEVLQIVRLRLKYFTDITNYIEMAIYATALVYLFSRPWNCKTSTVQAAAFSIFLGWLNLILYFRRMSFYGKYVIMLTAMFKTLLQVMVLFVLFLMAFGTTFYILMDNKPGFSTLWYSILKTFAMTLGELDMENNFIPSSKLNYAPAMNILFILFCLGMPIILMNMLIGLAVGDIDKIQQKSVMDRYVMQVELLLELESSLPSFIMRRVQVTEHIEYPNRKVPLRTRLYDKIQGFGQPENGEDEDELPPALAQIVDKMEDQQNKIDEMYTLVKQQAQVLSQLARREGLDTDNGSNGGRKGIVSWFRKR
ncbi:transient receptor potential cation channel subfamily A member 1 isoform X2 [Nematostella vectensis]|uniref:transient receptor potential cation channel subfamily A member 1 isoform X2 n=1 Tax=Nematostella vectensis TaxID=45351 RepID=UPI00207737F6|nr:transient receptor potential cation channel subfamily A member 1 isoform X2 [Nematostella vectensis]